MAIDRYRDLEIKAIYKDGKPAQYEKLVIAYKNKGSVKERTFISDVNGCIKTGITISKLYPKNTFFYYDGGQAYPKVLGRDTQELGEMHLLKVSSKDPITFTILYEYFDKNGSTKKNYFSDLYYQIYNKGKVVKIGDTDKNGKTAPLHAIKNQGYEIKIKPKNSSSYEKIKVRKKYQNTQNSIIKYDGKTSSYTLCLETFVGFKVVNNKNKGIPNVKVWLVDENGNKKGSTRKTDKNGLITPFIQNFSRKVKVSLQGCELTLKENEIVIPKPQGEDPYHIIEIKTIACSTIPDKPSTKATLSGKTDLPIVFDLETQELILLEPKNYLELKKEGSELSELMHQCHVNRRKLAQSLEPSATMTIDDIVDIEKQLKASEDLVKTKLNIDLKQKALIKEIYTLQRYIESGKTKIKLKRNYLNRDKYQVHYNNRVNKDGTNIDIKSIIRGSSLEDSPKNVDKVALKDSLDKIKRQASFKQYGERHFKDLEIFNEMLDVSGNELSKTIHESKEFKTEVSAQWLRAIGGWTASAAANMEPSKGKVGGELGFDISGKLVLCEANINSKAAYPSLQGWQLVFHHEATGELDLGAIRFMVECDVYGFAGAKAGISGAVSISFNGNEQEVQAIAKDPTLSASQLYGPVKTVNKPKFDPILDNKKFADAPVSKDLDIGVTAFAGAETGITPGGSLEWLSRDTNTFKALAKLSVTGAVSIGIGVEGCFLIAYAKGKFRIKAKAALCFGVGAKGEALFEVNAKLMIQFVSWVHSQLLIARFHVLTYIMKESFIQLSQFFVMMIGRKNSISENLENISQFFDRFSASLEKARERNKLAYFILHEADDIWLKHATPEAKGILLYQLTRHGQADKVVDIHDTTVNWGNVDIDYLPNRKAAIIKIFESVTIKREWQNVLQHMHLNGLKSDLGQNEGDIIRLLNHGLLLETDIQTVFDFINTRDKGAFKTNSDYSEYLIKYLELRAKVAPEYPDGVEVVKNTSPKYDIFINRGNVNSYEFYAAKNPEQYDPAGFEDDDDSYMV